jgi:hypothetical protein
MGCLKCIRTTAVELKILMKKKTSVAARFCSIANRAMSQLQGTVSCEGSPAMLHAADQGPAATPMTAFPPSRTETAPKILFGWGHRSRSQKEQISTYLSMSLFPRHLAESISLDVTAEVCEGLTRGQVESADMEPSYCENERTDDLLTYSSGRKGPGFGQGSG